MRETLISGVRVAGAAQLEKALESCGFARAVLLRETNRHGVDDFHVASMRTNAGSKVSLVLVKAYYDVDVVLRNALRMRQLGTGREALSIAWNNVECTVWGFSALAGCHTVRNEEKSCADGDVLGSSCI